MSDKDGNIDDLIRDGFDSKDDDFDFDSWSGIEQNLDAQADIDKQIIQAFDQIPEELPTSAWPEIKDELDINTVWKRINLQLTKKKRRGFIWWNVAAVSFLFLLAAFVFQDRFTNSTNITVNSSDRALTKKQTNLNTSIEKSIIVEGDYENEMEAQNFSLTAEAKVSSNGDIRISKIIDAKHENENGFDSDVLINSTIKNSSGQLQNNTKFTGDNLLTQRATLDLIQPLERSPINRLIQSNFDRGIPDIEIKPLDKNNKPLYQRRWVLGAFSSIDNNILLDATSRNAFSENSLASNNLTVSIDYGIYGQFYTKQNYFFQTEFYWNSKVKRSTQEFHHFEYVNRLVELDYYQLSLSAGKSLSFGKRNQTWFNPAIGFFGSYLKKSFEYENNALLTTGTNHKKWNYGLQVDLGIQHEFNRFIIGYGLHSNFGLSNIFEGSEQQSSLLNVSRTFTNGLYLRVGFKL